MSFNHHHPDKNQQAEALDIVLTSYQQGRSQPIPKDLLTSKVDLVNKLVAHIKEIHPDPNFAASLETELLQRQTSEPLPTTQSCQNSPSPSQRGNQTMRLTYSLRTVQHISLAALALVVITSVITISTPSLRILALEFIQVLQRTRSDQVGQPDSLGQQPRQLTEAEIAALQAEMRQTATVAEMEAERSFELKEPTFIPDGFELKEVVSPFAEIVALNYRNAQTDARFIVTQQRLTSAIPIVGPITLAPSSSNEGESQISIMWSKEPVFDDDPALAGGSPVGASATTEPIQIGNVVGEYVEGTWSEIISPNGSIQGMR
jgi:hypothetical protein